MVAWIARLSTHKKKRVLCIFWAMQGQVHWEVLHKGVSVTSDIYCQQLNQVDLAEHALFSKVYLQVA